MDLSISNSPILVNNFKFSFYSGNTREPDLETDLHAKRRHSHLPVPEIQVVPWHPVDPTGLLGQANQAIPKAQLVPVDQDLLADLVIQTPQGFPVGRDHRAVQDSLVVQRVQSVPKLQACQGHQILPLVHEDQMVLEVLDCLENLTVQLDQLDLVDPEVQYHHLHLVTDRSIQ